MSMSNPLNQLLSILYHLESLDPLFPKRVTGHELFFAISYRKRA